MSLIEHHRAAIELMDHYRGASGTRYANLDRVQRLERWLDTFDAHLIDNDILDYPGAEAKADAEWNEYDAAVAFTTKPGAMIEYNPSSLVMNDWYLPPPKRVERQHLLMAQQRRAWAWADDYTRKLKGRP